MKFKVKILLLFQKKLRYSLQNLGNKVFVLFEFIIKEELLKAFDNSDEENDFTKDGGGGGVMVDLPPVTDYNSLV
jgi:hypothetical protein